MAISIARVFHLLDILQSRALISASELTARLEMDARSLRRAVAQLQQLGIPVESVRGRYGGYRLRPGATLPPLMLQADEALVLSLGLLIAQSMGLGTPGSVVADTMMKLRRVVPAPLQAQVYALQASVTLDMPPMVGAPSLATLLLLSQSAYHHQGAHIRYVDQRQAVTERDIDCYGIVFHQGTWYAVGWCWLRQDIRIFRLDRIMQARASSAQFTPPASFDCLAFVLQHFAAIPDTWHIQVELHDSLERLRTVVPPTFATLEIAPSGVLLQAYDNDLAHMARFLVTLGCPFRVRQPAALRAQLRQLAAAIHDYAEEACSDTT